MKVFSEYLDTEFFEGLDLGSEKQMRLFLLRGMLASGIALSCTGCGSLGWQWDSPTYAAGKRAEALKKNEAEDFSVGGAEEQVRMKKRTPSDDFSVKWRRH